MAVPSNLFQRDSQVGVREDLTDTIYRIAPTTTPFVTAVDRVSASNTYHEWQTQALAAAGANAYIDGDDVSMTAATATARIGNYQQISKKQYGVSGTAEAVNKAGRRAELAYQRALKGLELRRDMEFIATRSQGSSAGGTGTARTTASVEAWLATNKTHMGTAGTTPGFSNGTVAAPTDGTQVGTLSEAQLKATIADCWTQGGQPDMVLVGPVAKQRISTFQGIATQYRENRGTAQATILAAADVYVSDFGELKIVPSHFSRDRTVLVLDTQYWAISYLRPMRTEALAKTGDSMKEHMVVEWGVVSRQEAASGKIADILVA